MRGGIHVRSKTWWYKHLESDVKPKNIWKRHKCAMNVSQVYTSEHSMHMSTRANIHLTFSWFVEGEEDWHILLQFE